MYSRSHVAPRASRAPWDAPQSCDMGQLCAGDRMSELDDSRACRKRSASFAPPAAFSAQRARRLAGGVRSAVSPQHRRPERVLGRAGAASCTGSKPPQQMLEWKPPFAKWFVGGTTQRRVQLPRSASAGRDAQQGRDHLGRRAGRDARAHVLRAVARGVSLRERARRRSASRSGDRVGIYMGMVPEAAIAMLACARIGAVHSVVFGGFAAEAVRDRMNDAQAKCVITQDGAFRRGSVVAAQAAGRQGARAMPERRARDRAARARTTRSR